MMTPKMPAGMLDAFKMLPMLDRLRDLMPEDGQRCAMPGNREARWLLDELPILKTWPEDGGRYITLPLVITEDPETGVRNIGTYRMQVFDGAPPACTGSGTRVARSTIASPNGWANVSKWQWR